MAFRPRRSPLSIVALRTHRALVFLLGFGAVGLFASYLFLMNHLSMQGYVLSKTMEEHQVLSQQEGELEAILAKSEAREYIQKSDIGKTLIVQGISKTYVIVPSEKVTAQR
ncbi:MAG TPA: hypothetical protein VIT68_00280 [Candidatus Gracilibacteria bacterium]